MKQGQVDQEYDIVDYETKEIICQIIGSPDQFLNITRESIKQSWPNLKDFEFCYQQGNAIPKGVEKKVRLSKIPTKNFKIYLKRIGPTKEEKDTKKQAQREKKIQQINKDKIVINSALKLLDQLKNLRMRKICIVDYSQQQKRIQKLNKCLADLNIDMKLQNTDDLYKAQTFFNSRLEQSQKAIQFLKMKVMSQIEMLKNSDNVFRGYFMGNQVLQKIVDYNKLQFNFDNENCDFTKSEYECMTKDQTEQFQKKYNLSNTKKEMDVGFATVGFAIKAGADQAKLKQNSSLTKNETQTEFTKKYLCNSFIGATLSVTQEKVAIINDVKQDYDILAKEYFDKKAKGTLEKYTNFSKKCINFFEKYGYEIEIGDYLFGSTYILENELRFSKSVSLNYAKEITDMAFNFSSAAGGFTQTFIAGSFYNSQKTGTQYKKEDLEAEYRIYKTVRAWPSLQCQRQWRQVVPLATGFWKMVQKNNTQMVQLPRLMTNRKNITEYLKSLGEKLYQFQKFVSQVYQQDYISKKLKKQKQIQNKIHLVLVGRTGCGKSTFGNQLIGEDLQKPFIVSNKAEYGVNLIDHRFYGDFNIYDTPGFCDNRQGYENGYIIRVLSQSINKQSKNNINHYINCFIFVIYAANRVSFQPELDEFKQAFGKEALKNTLFILNMQKPPKNFDPMYFVQNSKNFTYIKQICPTFDYQKQIYWNYKFDLEKKTQEQWFHQYQGHRNKILHMAQQLGYYTSEYYERIRKQAQKAQQLQNKKQQQILQLLQQTQNKKIQKYFSLLSYFTLQSQDSKYYVGFGKIGMPVFGEDGFNLFQSPQRLALQMMIINIKEGYISGYLRSEKREDAIMSTNQGNRLGYGRPSLGNNIQQVKIYFLKGKNGLISMSLQNYDNQVQVKISGEYLVDKAGQLYTGIDGTCFYIRKAM